MTKETEMFLNLIETYRRRAVFIIKHAAYFLGSHNYLVIPDGNEGWEKEIVFSSFTGAVVTYYGNTSVGFGSPCYERQDVEVPYAWLDADPETEEGWENLKKQTSIYVEAKIKREAFLAAEEKIKAEEDEILIERRERELLQQLKVKYENKD